MMYVECWRKDDIAIIEVCDTLKTANWTTDVNLSRRFIIIPTYSVHTTEIRIKVLFMVI